VCTIRTYTFISLYTYKKRGRKKREKRWKEGGGGGSGGQEELYSAVLKMKFVRTTAQPFLLSPN
jgi:hypothetical protein